MSGKTFSPHKPIIVDIGGKQIGDSHVLAKHPFRHLPVPLVDPRLGQVQERPRHRERRHQQPDGGEQPPGHRIERPIPVPDRGDRHHRQVERIKPTQVLDEVHRRRTHPDADDDDAKCERHLHPDPHPALLHVDEVRVLATSVAGGALDGGEEELLLDVEDVGDDAAEEDVDEAEADEDEEDGEELGGRGGGGDVAVADGAHGDDAEVERVDDGVGLGGGKLVAVEVVDDHAEGEVEEEEEEGLPDDGGGDRGGGGLVVVVLRMVEVVDGGHGRRRLGPVEVRLGPEQLPLEIVGGGTDSGGGERGSGVVGCSEDEEVFEGRGSGGCGEGEGDLLRFGEGEEGRGGRS